MKNNKCGKILLYKGTGFISYCIRWFTRSQYSHAALLYPDGNTVIESIQFHGVRKRTLADYDEPYDSFIIKNVTNLDWKNILKTAEKELGWGYDYRSIIRFLTRQKAGTPRHRFCSEAVFAWVLKGSAIRLLERIEDWEVDPGDLRLSYYLIRESTGIKKV